MDFLDITEQLKKVGRCCLIELYSYLVDIIKLQIYNYIISVKFNTYWIGVFFIL